MYEFQLPNYRDGSIVNLMSSISNNYGKKHRYRELSSLSSEELKKFKNIVLIIIDGLGYNYLAKKKESFLYQHLKTSMTSVFLSTTACACTAFLTGYPPQQHALTGWDINLKEVGALTTIFPFTPVYGGESLSKFGFEMDKIMDIEPLHKEFNAKSFTVIDKKIAISPFNQYVSKETEAVPINSYKNAFAKIKKLIGKKSASRKFIHVYFPEFDHFAHEEGISSKEVDEIFLDIDKKIKNLSGFAKGTNTLLIVTADHGFINSPKESEIWVEKIPGMKECLTIPLAGEPRTRDVFVRPGKAKEFEKIAKTKLSKYCWCFKGEQLIRDQLYGLGEPNKKLIDRVGDYVLIMKGNYILRNKLANYVEKDKFHLGKHGGVSRDEMIVPLVIIDSE